MSTRGWKQTCCALWVYLGLTYAASALAVVESVIYVYTDPQGTVLAEADEAGNITAEFEYRPYGRLALGTVPNGPGFTGHVSDADTGLVYMQARYYDPDIGRFISADPIAPKQGDSFSFNLYAYADNNPIMKIDPSGRNAQLFWTAPNQVTYTVPYIVGLAYGTNMPVSASQINEAVSRNFSGTVNINGVAVTVTAQAIEANGFNTTGRTNFVLFVPDTQGITQSGRGETNRVGGERITLSSSGRYAATPNTVAHELGGHAGGAGDQYVGGVGADGNAIQREPEGAAGIMKSLNGGPANQQTLNEIIRAPTNTNTCAPGVRSASGGC